MPLPTAAHEDKGFGFEAPIPFITASPLTKFN